MGFVSSAQDSFVVTTKQDTLVGKVALSYGDAYSSDALSVKTDKKKHKLKAYEVGQVFLEQDSSFLHTIKLDGRYRFVKLLHQGSFLKLYAFINVTQGQREFGSQILIKVDGGQHKIVNIGFKKRIFEFLTECPEVADKFHDRTYGKKDLMKAMDAYNACINEQSKVNENEANAIMEAAKIGDLISTVSNSRVHNKEELIDMLVGVQGKMESQQTIPSYLKMRLLIN